MSLFKKLDSYAAPAWQRFVPLALVFAVLTIILIGADSYLGLSAGWPGKAAKSAGKRLGEMAEVLTLLAALYYFLREGYALIRQGPVSLPSPIAEGLRTLIRLTRLTHPLIGVIVLCLTLLHGYLLLFVWHSAMGKEVVSGLAALAVLAAVGATGWIIYGMPQARWARLGHRYTGLFFFGLYLVHKVLAD